MGQSFLMSDMRIQYFTVPPKVFYQFSIYCKIYCIWLWHAATFNNKNFCFLWINTKCILGFSNAFFVEQRGHELACFVDGTKHLMENNESSNPVIERLYLTFQAQLDRNLCKVRLPYFSTDLFLSFTKERIFFFFLSQKCVLALNDNDLPLGNGCAGVAWLEPGGQSSVILGCEIQLWPAASCNSDDAQEALGTSFRFLSWDSETSFIYIVSKAVIQWDTEDADNAVSPAPLSCL